MTFTKIVAVIMAGGKGERLWPYSKIKFPKQFLSLTGDGITMMQKTFFRILPLVNIEDIFIATDKDYVQIVRSQLPQIPHGNILAEPRTCNTAPCIAFAAAVIERLYGDALMLVIPSDHSIKDEDLYIDALKQASCNAERGQSIVTIGIKPTYPETGYGYIKYTEDSVEHPMGTYVVDEFVEKPNIDTAEKYLSTGNYLWNSGIFAWKVSTILHQIEKLMPDTFLHAMKIGKAYGTIDYESVLQQSFSLFKPESIDYGIMERVDGVYVVLGKFCWDDAGSWKAMERVNKKNNHGNVIQGDVIEIGTNNSIIIGKKMIAAIGLESLVVVDTEDVLLLCAKKSLDELKTAIDALKEHGRCDLL